MSYSLMLNTSVVDGTPSPIENITSIATGWRRWIDWMGGYDIGEFIVYGQPHKLRNYFETWLRLDIAEIVLGAVTWNGEVRKMDLVQGNMPISIDFNECFNHILATYGSSATKTAWANNDESIAKYGYRAYKIHTSGATQTVAENERDKMLTEVGWPPLIPARDMRQKKTVPHLKVYVMGYKYSVNDLITYGVSDGTAISTVIDDIVDYSHYVTARNIDTNSNTVFNDFDNERRWDSAERLLKMTDSSGNLFHGWIDENRNFSYKIVNLTPTYYVRNGRVFTDMNTSMEIHPRWAAPGIYRDMDSILIGQNRSGLLNDRNDFLVERVCVDAQDNLGFSTGDVYDFMTILRSNVAESTESSSTSNKWNWNQMSDEQKEWWTAGRVGPAPD